jgi:hypothetical protein
MGPRVAMAAEDYSASNIGESVPFVIEELSFPCHSPCHCQYSATPTKAR